MRINLNTKWAEKDQAKALGARWDGKTWYIVDMEDLTPFMRWISRPAEASKPVNKRQERRGRHAGKAASKKPKITASKHVQHCGCYHVLPWEDCEHTLAGEEDFELTEMDIEAQKHLRSF